MSERLLAVIRTQSEIAKTGPDLAGVMAIVCRRAVELTPADGAVIELAEGDEMVYRAASGTFDTYLGLRLPRIGSISGLCVERREPLRCDDSETDPRVNIAACRKVGLRSMIVVPLRHNETVVGALKVMSAHPAAFGEEDLHILGLLSEIIAAAMFHAARFETDRLVYEATHDALTGLANRALFYDRLRAELENARRNNHAFGILNLDMDGLKPINDLMGHRAGDAALKEFAGRLLRAARKGDTVARVGGDEFAVIVPGIVDAGTAVNHAGRLSESVSGPFSFEEKSLALGASVGSAVYPSDGDNLDALVEKADQAMYEIKRTRKIAR